MTPYTTKSGVKVGLLHTPKPPVMTRDEERIQAILLSPERTFRFPAWLLVVFILGCYILVSCVKELP